jgi:hypothetical protein
MRSRVYPLLQEEILVRRRVVLTRFPQFSSVFEGNNILKQAMAIFFHDIYSSFLTDLNYLSPDSLPLGDSKLKGYRKFSY